MPAFEWVHVQLHQQKGMISLSPPTICNSAKNNANFVNSLINELFYFVFKKIIITNKLAYTLCGYL
ncbi:hypothetical protein [Proteus mirabilis]|uniref:hypothetical protein n=1 Tax=Proteus mirabilis TaxID=584 RepID=UPI00374FB931